MKKKKLEVSADQSASNLIQQIKVGVLDPLLLDKDQRQMCVEALFSDSLSPAGIAQFLKVSDRTIRRDMEEIRVKNALTPDPDLAKGIIGEFLLFARIHRGNLMKLARDGGASVGERSQAEYYAYMVGADLIIKLQSLGYLPKSADALVVLQKTEENKTNERLVTLLGELRDMTTLESRPEQANKLIQLRENIIKENSNDKK